MAYTIQVGSLRCHILSDGLQYVDGGGFFGVVPRSMWQEVIAPNELNQIPCDSRSLLIESAAGLILVDTGVGDKLPPKVRQRFGMDNRERRLVGELRARRVCARGCRHRAANAFSRRPRRRCDLLGDR